MKWSELKNEIGYKCMKKLKKKKKFVCEKNVQNYRNKF